MELDLDFARLDHRAAALARAVVFLLPEPLIGTGAGADARGDLGKSGVDS
jgi:hypothetical protein